MKSAIYSTNSKKEISLPKIFSSKIREDIVERVLEAKKRKQPYSPSPVAGKSYSSRGKIRHRRHVWQTHYGRGMSRVPRKVMSRRGTQFNWEAAGIPSAKGGNRAHPPKVISMIGQKSINKKELKIAFESAISATANKNFISKKYSTIDPKNVKDVPIIIDSKLIGEKIKKIKDILKNALGELYNVSEKKKSKRSGRGKLRGRKYKSNAGLLIVLGEGEKLKTKTFDVKNVKNLGVEDLAKGGLGRVVIYSEKAIKYLGGENEK